MDTSIEPKGADILMSLPADSKSEVPCDLVHFDGIDFFRMIISSDPLYLNDQMIRSWLSSTELSHELQFMFIRKLLADRGIHIAYMVDEARRLSSATLQYDLIEKVVDQSLQDLLPLELKQKFINRSLHKKESSFILASMVKNESTLTLLWALYHAQIVGYENILILDNGSTDEAGRRILKCLTEMGVNVEYQFNKDKDFKNKGNILFNRAKLYADREICVGLLDIDELLFAFDDERLSFAPAIIEYELSELSKILSNACPAMRIGKRYINIPCSYEVSPTDICKGFVHSSWPHPIGHGFHFYAFEDHREYPFRIPLMRNIGELHFHFSPWLKMLARSRDKIVSAFGVSDSNDIKKLYADPATKAFIMADLMQTQGEYREGLKRLHNDKTRNIEKEWRECGLPYPYLNEEI